MTDATEPDPIPLSVSVNLSFGGGTVTTAGPIEATALGRGAWVIRLPVLIIEEVRKTGDSGTTTTPSTASPTPTSSGTAAAATVKLGT